MPAQDFKRLGDGDTGPEHRRHGRLLAAALGAGRPRRRGHRARSLQPTVDELARRGTPFAGLLYAGLALTSRGRARRRVQRPLRRPGDPGRAAPCCARRWPALLRAAATGRLAGRRPLRWTDGAAVTVVVAAASYPATPRTGDPIGGLPTPTRSTGAYVLHAGTALGRTAGWSAPAAGCCRSWAPARTSTRPGRGAYAAVACIELAGAQHRTDIAAAAVAGEVIVP